MNKLILLLTLFASTAHAGLGGMLEGSEPYTPTKAEWSALQLQVLHGSSSKDMVVTFTSHDSVIVTCRISHSEIVSYSIIEQQKEICRDSFDFYIRAIKGWSKIKLFVDVREYSYDDE